jgi:hypothetical protein
MKSLFAKSDHSPMVAAIAPVPIRIFKPSSPVERRGLGFEIIGFLFMTDYSVSGAD